MVLAYPQTCAIVNESVLERFHHLKSSQTEIVPFSYHSLSPHPHPSPEQTVNYSLSLDFPILDISHQ